MELTEGGCSRGITQWTWGCAWTPSSRRGTASYTAHTRHCIGVAPCTIPPTSTNTTRTEAAKEAMCSTSRSTIRGGDDRGLVSSLLAAIKDKIC